MDAAPRRALQRLGLRETEELAFVTSRDDSGEVRALGIAGKRVGAVKLGPTDISPLVKRLNNAFSQIADEEAAAEYKTLWSKGTIDLLRELAKHGAKLRETLYKHNAVEDATRIQVVTASESGFLPLELVYSY